MGSYAALNTFEGLSGELAKHVGYDTKTQLGSASFSFGVEDVNLYTDTLKVNIGGGYLWNTTNISLISTFDGSTSLKAATFNSSLNVSYSINNHATIYAGSTYDHLDGDVDNTIGASWSITYGNKK